MLKHRLLEEHDEFILITGSFFLTVDFEDLLIFTKTTFKTN